jgi:DNA helicase-2/ATP-dependent DNA helicase PcrA
LDGILKASYQRVLVDEYQDCSVQQHNIVKVLARRLPTCVFGDPLQAIFGFSQDDPLPDWTTKVEAEYPSLGELTIPWRWNNLGANDLGQWVLGVRAALLDRQPIDLRQGGDRVHWRQLTGNPADDILAQVNEQYRIERDPTDKLLIIGDSRRVGTRHDYARSAKGVGVVERVDLTELVTWAKKFDAAVGGQALFDEVLGFAKDVVVNLGADKLIQRLDVIQRGRNTKSPAPEELAAQALINGGGIRQAVHFLQKLAEDRYRRIFRAGLFWPMVETMNQVTANPEMTLHEAAVKVREMGRYVGRRIPAKAVGSTLLLKGLESDHALILDAGTMTASHLYVAISRGAKSVTIFSNNPIINPSR